MPRFVPKRLLYGSATLTLLGALGAGVWYVSMVRQQASLDVGVVYAPDFALVNSVGETITLSESDGTIRVLNFWASWSPYSKDELSVLASLAEEYGKDVTLLAIGRDTNQADGKRFLAELGLSSASWALFDPADTYYDELGGFNMPETVVLGEDGAILYQIHGPHDPVALRAAITQGLANE